jgi:hypothetical protein
MLNRLGLRLSIMVAVTQVVGCSRFVWHEDPFTPDPAPTSEIIASASDTTYVLRRDSYYLLTSQRSTLWSRDVIDDVAWRYRALFGRSAALGRHPHDTGHPPYAIRPRRGVASRSCASRSIAIRSQRMQSIASRVRTSRRPRIRHAASPHRPDPRSHGGRIVAGRSRARRETGG